ncbi:MAG: S8 family serine peptidase [candidate division Zixibacteria bacterium]|nr:S8 family serine peptidase [candidate division Zixibacteria bacterium]
MTTSQPKLELTHGLVRRLRRVTASIAWIALSGLLTPNASAATVAGRDPSTLIVKLRPPASGKAMTITRGHSGRADFDRLADALRIPEVRQVFPPRIAPDRLRAEAEKLRMADFVEIRIPDGADLDPVKAQLAQSPDVELVEDNVIERIDGGAMVPNDPYFDTLQYGPHNTGVQPPYDPGTAGADCDMEAAWGITTGDSNTVLAIIDTGIDYNHPDLYGKIWLNGNELDEKSDDGIDNDSNGFVDDFIGWNFADNSNSPHDDNGHGTHVSGIAGAIGDNGVGIAGMNWKCRLMAVKVLDATGSGTSTQVAQGIYYATNNGADVISMSLGHLGAPAPAESIAVMYAYAAGVTVVAAMGNNNAGTTNYPAAYDSVISVGATNSRDRRAVPFCFSPTSGSNFGPWIDVCAPGDNVWSLLPTYFGSYGNRCGTSMATPHVSGLAALIKGLRPAWPPDSVRYLIRRSAEDQVGDPSEDTPGFDIYYGYGRINGRIALQALTIPFPPILSVPGAQTVTEGDTLSFTVSASDSNLTDPMISAAPLTNTALTDHGNGTATLQFIPDYTQAGSYALQFIASDGTLADTDSVAITVLNGCQCPCHGDPKCDGASDILDVVKTIEVAFRGAAAIFDVDCFPDPGGRTDVNCSGVTDIIDVVKVIDVAFRGQPATFCNPCSP